MQGTLVTRAAALLVLSLTSCGGGGGSDAGADATEPSTDISHADPGPSERCPEGISLFDKPCEGALRVCVDALTYRQRVTLACDDPADGDGLHEMGIDAACCEGEACADRGTQACRPGEICVHEEPPGQARADKSYDPCRQPSARFRSTFCCQTDEDCRLGLGGTNYRCVLPAAGKASSRVCLPRPPAGACWDDDDCPRAQACLGGSGGCACDANCPLKLGTCS